MNEQIKDVTPNSLLEAIMKNQDLWGVTPDDTKMTGGTLKRKYGKWLYKYADEITTENLLKWLHEDRPELFSIIINTEWHGEQLGILWFSDQVYKIKRKIFEM